MSTTKLQTPILRGGIYSVNFFNGRLLSGEDLSQEQAANRETHRRLGQALGEGVINGLEVFESRNISTVSTPVVTVTAGLAVNRQGQALALSSSIDVSLVHPISATTQTTAAETFGDCAPPQQGVYVAGEGVYLLTIGPARGAEGRVPVSGLGNITAACNTRYTVEGVQLRLIQLDVALGDPAHLRNSVAYQCFGMPARQAFAADPFGPFDPSYGLIDDLRPNRLTECDLPLAVLYWTETGGLQFVDMWSVRRRLAIQGANDQWPALIGARRAGEAEAMLLQFADHIRSIRARESNLEQISATARFRYLPPVGAIPLSGMRGQRGFEYRKFFQDLTYREPVFVEGARVEPLLRAALASPPIDLASRELIWLYLVRENIQAIDNQPIGAPQGYLIFASGHMPDIGDAHYDVNRWSYSNFT